MVRSIPWNRCHLAILTLCAFGVTSLVSDSAHANNGGSWGSSHGGYHSSGGNSSGGSSGGALAGRRPVRNLLGRLGSRLSGSLGSSGSMGSSGSTGSTGTLLSRRAYGSNGGYGSNGSYASSGGYASTGSTGSHYGGSTGSAYSNWDNTYVSSPVYQSNYVPPTNDGCVSPGCTVEQSYPVGNYGFINGYPIQNAGSVPMTGTPTGAFNSGPITDGPIDDMLDGRAGGMNATTPPEYYPDATPAAGGEGAAPSPGPAGDDDATSISRTQADALASILSLELPAEAKVFINDKSTSTTGVIRNYRSSNRGAKFDQELNYRVKAVVVRGGKELVRTKLVTMRPGQNETVKFEFDEPNQVASVVTKLDLRVPANAKVTLCGSPTKHTGVARTFETQSLATGQIWQGYKVEVEFERGGQTVTEERLIDMVGGQSHSLAIGFDTASDRVAAK